MSQLSGGPHFNELRAKEANQGMKSESNASYYIII